ncbi:hypothetical protein NMY22_g10259 [Coprinellus aureogranulatus]|nr:hypothetical protein NMY22_g10259 [Coprinellus aureogranulatus]
MKAFSTLHALLAAALPIAVYSAQIPFHSDVPEQATGQKQWKFDVGPSPNATENYIFESVSSLLQQWPNTRYRNGHTIVPVTIPRNTLLYHGTWHKQVPSFPDWVATDPEHSQIFCVTSDVEKGCWQLTLAVTRPLKVLHFDGSSAAKMQGSMDAQDIIAWGQVEPKRIFDEASRIKDLCAWGKKYDIDGFLRMEMNFEIMLCDFTKNVEVVSFLNLIPPRLMDGPPLPKMPGPTPPDAPPHPGNKSEPRLLGIYRVIESGHTHNHFPGETRAQLELSRLVSFYDIDTFPSLIESRSNQERFFHRIGRSLIFPEVPRSGVDWTSLIRVIKHRYADRLEVLQYMLNKTKKPEETIQDVHAYVQTMLAPYILNSAKPEDSSASIEWAAPVFEHCASTHTKTAHTTLRSKLTPSEHLILRAVDGVLHEVCRVLVGVWADGVVKVKRGSKNHIDNPIKVVSDWSSRINGLVEWLDWNEWVKCKPSCEFEETCYLPTWPFLHGKGWPKAPPVPPNSQRSVNPEDPTSKRDRMHGWVRDFTSSENDDDDYWRRPQPKCIRRVFPYEIL